jgi:hypothetical protein
MASRSPIGLVKFWVTFADLQQAEMVSGKAGEKDYQTLADLLAVYPVEVTGE